MTALSIDIRGCLYTLISKFNVKDRNYINLTSRDSRGTDRELTFATSNSECGFWRLCITDGVTSYMEKGRHYTMSGFIILELQFFIMDNIQQVTDITDNTDYNEAPLPEPWRKYLPPDGTVPFYYIRGINATQYNHPNDTINMTNLQTGCSRHNSRDVMNATLNNLRRDIIFNVNDITNYDHESIRPVYEYKYTKELSNNHPVNPNYQQQFTALPSLERKKQAWPEDVYASFTSSFAIRYGNTVIQLRGTIYSIIADTPTPYIKIKIFYMIYDCDIIIPDDIHTYQQPEGSTFHFPERINERKLIIPIYFLPEYSTDTELDYDISGYGLYNKFIALQHDFIPIDTCKFLDYIWQTRNIHPPTPTCTTVYSFLGYYYDKLKFLNDIKLHMFPELPSHEEGAASGDSSALGAASGESSALGAASGESSALTLSTESTSEVEPLPDTPGGSKKYKKRKTKHCKIKHRKTKHCKIKHRKTKHCKKIK
jgi:hypothetical protein